MSCGDDDADNDDYDDDDDDDYDYDYDYDNVYGSNGYNDDRACTDYVDVFMMNL